MLKKQPNVVNLKRGDSDSFPLNKAIRRNSYGRKTSVPGFSSPNQSPRSDQSPKSKTISYPLSIFVDRTVRIKGPNILRVEEGDVITLVNLPTEDSTMIHVRHGKEEGLIPICALNLNKYTYNIYLDTVELLIQYPKLLIGLLDDSDNSDIVLQIVPILIARRLIPDALNIVFKSELIEKQNHITEMFRSKSAATIMVSTIFNNPQNLTLQKFRTDFVNFAISQINENDCSIPSTILEKCIDYLSKEPVPDELIVVLKSLNNAINSQTVVINISIIGSLFFLRFICPALVQPQEFCGIKDVNGNIQKSLITITKALQLVSNQTAEDEGLIKLYKPTSDFLMKIVSMPMPILILTSDSSLILEAVTVYSYIYFFAEKYSIDIKPIIDRLGLPPQTLPNLEEDVPMWNTINDIKNYLNEIT